MLAERLAFVLKYVASPLLFLLAGKKNVKKCLPKIMEHKQLRSFGQRDSRDGFPLSQQAVA